MSHSFVRTLVTALGLCAASMLWPASASAQTPPSNGSADARLRALYTEEWNWRRREFARTGDQQGPEDASDRFPKVDAASQQARLGTGHGRWRHWMAFRSTSSLPRRR